VGLFCDLVKYLDEIVVVELVEVLEQVVVVERFVLMSVEELVVEFVAELILVGMLEMVFVEVSVLVSGPGFGSISPAFCLKHCLVSYCQ
jgi:hypothetical protein